MASRITDLRAGTITVGGAPHLVGVIVDGSGVPITATGSGGAVSAYTSRLVDLRASTVTIGSEPYIGLAIVDADGNQITSFGGGTSALLSATHTDTTADTVVRGDLITGQGGTPTWTRLAKGSANTVLKSDGTDLSWTATPSFAGLTMTGPITGTAGTVEFYASTTPHLVKIYDTRTDGSNFSRLSLHYASGRAIISTEGAGTGTAATLNFGIAGTRIWQITQAGHFIGVTDNTYDIGASGATRPRSMYVGTNVTAGGFIDAASYKVGAVAGASGGPFTSITSITVVNGIVTAITGT